MAYRKHDPHVDCPFCWTNKGADHVIHCALCWQTRSVPVALAVEFSLTELEPYSSTHKWNRRFYSTVKQELRRLRKAHGLKNKKWS